MQIYKAPGTFEINWKHSHVIKPKSETSQGDPPSNTLEHPQTLPLSTALEHWSWSCLRFLHPCESFLGDSPASREAGAVQVAARDAETVHLLDFPT